MLLALPGCLQASPAKLPTPRATPSCVTQTGTVRSGRHRLWTKRSRMLPVSGGACNWAGMHTPLVSWLCVHMQAYEQARMHSAGRTGNRAS